MTSTITFYEVEADVDGYQYLLVEDEAVLEWILEDRKVFGNGKPWSDVWKPPNVISFQPRLPEGDFWGVLDLGRASFAIRPEALEHGHLEVFLGRAGELLPLPYGGREFRLLNITECIDALDQEHTIWDRHGVDLDDPDFADTDRYTKEALAELPETVRVETPCFRIDRLGLQLFKVPETAITHIYYWESSEDGEDEQFRRYCEREGLTGLTFSEIYSVDVDWVGGEWRARRPN